MIWRYDPVILGGELDREWHLRNLVRIIDKLGGAGQRLILSAVDPYRRARSALAQALGQVSLDPSAYAATLARMAEEARGRGLMVQSCCEPSLGEVGLKPGRCVDAQLLAEAAGLVLSSSPRLHRQREGCLCHWSVDIGAYDTCPAGCVYCYAVKSPARARSAHASHDPSWPCLTCSGTFRSK